MSTENSDLILSSIVSCIRAASSLAAQDITFHRRLDPDVANLLDTTSSNILSLLNKVLFSIDENNEFVEAGKDNLENAWKDLGNVMDNLLEKSDHAFDIIKIKENYNESSNMQYLEDKHTEQLPEQKIQKPQITFNTPIDNSESHPFKPLLKEKPNALKSLSDVNKLIIETEDSPPHYPHPYHYEIETQGYNELLLKIQDPIDSQPWNGTDAIWVDNIKALEDMTEELLTATEIAIDLEHHDYRSYYGIVSLMQISNRNKDWLIDTIALREDLQILNRIFTDPFITKVFHGAFMDIIWLQRDLGLYIVSLFDTYHASRLLGFPRHSLAYLLERFAHFKTSKKYQLADWRIRPLPKSMYAYARSDTHFLLNIYDHLRNSLIRQNKLSEALHESRNVAKRRFEYSAFRPNKLTKDVFTPIEKDKPWITLMCQYNISPQKELLMEKLYKWRDLVARKDDESPRYVMSNQLLVSLVVKCPTNSVGILSCSNFISDHVRENSVTLANLLRATSELITSGGYKTENRVYPYALNSNSVQTLSLLAIKDAELKFNHICSLYSNDRIPHEKSQINSLLFQQTFFDSDVVSYLNNLKTIIKSKKLQERKTNIFEKFEQALLSNQFISIHDIPKNNISELKYNEDTIESDHVTQETNHELNYKKDEIIVLKKRKIENYEKPTNITTIDKEDIDYKKTKILDNGNPKSKDVCQKKKGFDPYSIEDNKPQQPVKRNKSLKGRNISFKL